MLNADQSPAGIEHAARDGLLQRLRQAPQGLPQVTDEPKMLVAAVAALVLAALVAATASAYLFADPAIAYGIVLVAAGLIVAPVGRYVWSARHPAPHISAGTTDASPRGILRSVAPFARRPLPERADEAEAIFDMVTAVDYRFGGLVGRLGSGKTSLLRAELLPRLTAAGLPAVYVPTPGSDAMTATREAILRRLPREAGPPVDELASADLTALLRMLIQHSGATVTVIYDQFDAFLLGPHQPHVHDAFVNWLRSSVGDAGLQVRFLFAVRDDLISRFLALEALVVEGHAATSTYELHDLTPNDAERVLRQAVFSREAAFEPGLISALVGDLADGGLVSPTLLQIVATWLRQREIKTVRQYQQEGEATGILQAYVRRQLEDSQSPLVARVILRVLVQEPIGSAGGVHPLDEIRTAVRALGAENGNDQDLHLLPILGQLTSARLAVRRSGEGYVVAYPLLQPCIVAALDELTGTQREQAPEAARHAAAHWTDDRMSFRLRDLGSSQYGELQTGQLTNPRLSPTGSARVFITFPNSPVFTTEGRLLHLPEMGAP